METARLFTNAGRQTLLIPEEYEFKTDKVNMKKIGDLLLTFPLDSAWANFINSPPASDDFGDAIFEARRNAVPNAPRESL